jgi:hypothetical protein
MDAISSATHFSDVRHAFHGGVELRVGPTTLDAGYTYAFENDYRSHEVDASARVDLWGKNTTFRLDYSHNFDSVCDVDNRGADPLNRRALDTSVGCFSGNMGLVTEPLAIDSYAGSWTQVLTPILVSELSVGFQALDGFQSNPYRRVRLFFGTVEAQESEPLLRQRVAVMGRMHLAIKKLHASAAGSARYYWDTWGVNSATVELDWEQYFLPQLLVRLRGRFYQQGRALFYRDAGEAQSYDSVGPRGQYFTGDRELSHLKSADERGKILRAFEGIDLNAKVDLISYQPLTPHPPNEDRSRSVIGALLVQAGASLKW